MCLSLFLKPILVTAEEQRIFDDFKEQHPIRGYDDITVAEERLQTLQQIVDKFFGTDCESAETENGTWKLAIAEGDKVESLLWRRTCLRYL